MNVTVLQTAHYLGAVKVTALKELHVKLEAAAVLVAAMCLVFIIPVYRQQ